HPCGLPCASAAAPAAKVTVPNVVGRLQAAAKTRLRRAHLRPHVVRVKSPELVGTVVAEKPRPGAKIPAGSRVTISISAGPGPYPCDEPPGARPGGSVAGQLLASAYGTEGGSSSSTVGKTSFAASIAAGVGSSFLCLPASSGIGMPFAGTCIGWSSVLSV